MICLTGDVHHSSRNTDDLRFCRESEISAAKAASKIAENYGIKLTLFFTGKCVLEAPDLVRTIAGMEKIEVGGHNYDAFHWKRLFNLYYRLTGIKNGPYRYQAWDVRRTLAALQKVTADNILSWRDHGYRHDKNTREILACNNIRFLSDTLSAEGAQPKINQGIIDVPINTIPYHDYVYHGARQPGSFDEMPLKRSVFRTGAMTKEEWLERIKAQVRDIDGTGGIAVILAHPACMEVMDDFFTFEKLCGFISTFETVNMKDICIETHKMKSEELSNG